MTDVSMQRRVFLGSATLSVLASAWIRPSAALGDTSFVAVWRALDTSLDDDRYALALREAMTSLDATAWNDVKRAAPDADGVAQTTLWSRGGLALREVVLAPNATLTARLHSGDLTISRGLAGPARFERYETVDAPPASDDTSTVFDVRCTREGLLTGQRLGDATFLPGAIRVVRAGPAGATFLDVVTERGGNRAHVAVDIARTAHNAFAGLHAARWIDVAR